MPEEKEIPASAIMYELKQINTSLSELKQTQQTILHELGGNGRPGIRTRLYSLETGYEHIVRKMNSLEERFDKKCEELDKENEETNRQILALRNIGAGIAIAITILQVLSWLIPLLNQTP